MLFPQIVVSIGIVAGLVFQESPLVDDADVMCGPICLAIALSALQNGESPTVKELAASLDVTEKGCSLADLNRVASDLGLHTVLADATLESLAWRTGQLSCIARVEDAHFVLIKDVTDDSVTVIDASKEYVVPAMTFSAMWDGSCLLISTNPLPDEDSLGRRIWWYHFIRRAAFIVALFAAIGAAGYGIRRFRRGVSDFICRLGVLYSGLPMAEYQINRLMIVVFVVVSFLIAAISGCRSPVNAPPAESNANDSQSEISAPDVPTSFLSINPNPVEMGTIVSGQDTTVRCQITNVGAKAIRIHDVLTTCNCTSAAIAKSDLAAGDSTEVTAVVRPSVLGPNSVHLKLRDSSLSLLGDIQIRFVGSALVPVEPSMMFFGRVAIGDQSSMKLLIRGDNDLVPNWDPSQLESVQAYPDDELSWSKEVVDEHIVLSVQLHPKQFGSTSDGGIVMKFPEPVGQVQVKAEWTVVEDLTVEPSRLFIGLVHPAEQWSRKVLIRSADGEISEILEGAVNRDLTLEMVRISGQIFRCEVAGAAPSNPGPFSIPVEVLVKRQSGDRTLLLTVSGIVE